MGPSVQKGVREIEPGMTLGRDLYGPTGRFLLKKGEKLSGDVIAWLDRQGIEQVWVLLEPTPSPQEQPASCWRTIVDDLERRFSRVSGDPLMAQIKKTIADHLGKAA